MRPTTVFAAVVFAFVFCVSASADIPEVMSYQGVLRDGSGNPVPDGGYDVSFRIYDVETGGTPLWTETQTLTATGGIIYAHLGSVTTLTTLEFDVPYWLGISVEGGAELVPLTALTTAPYAAHAGWADHCIEADDDWRILGDDIHHDVGNVGIGTATPDVKLDVFSGYEPCARFDGGSGTLNFTVRAHNDGGTAGAFFSATEPSSYPPTPAGVAGISGGGSLGGYFYSADHHALVAASPNGRAIWGVSGGDYAGYFEGGGLGVYVDDQLETNTFRMQPGAATGYVLTSDGVGVGTWQSASAGSDGDWTVAGSNMYSTPTGNVGIGVAAPAAKLEVSASSGGEALLVRHNGSPSRTSNIERTTLAVAGNDILQISTPFGSSDGCQLIEAERGGVPVFSVNGNGLIVGSRGASLTDNVEISDGQLLVDYYGDHVVEISTVYTASGAHVLHVECPDTGVSDDGIAVYGQYEQATDYGIGGKFEGGYMGVWGIADNAGGSLEHVGVRAVASGGNYNYGILASAAGGTAYSGYFMGNVNVDGTLTADTKNFKIDHPLDPANKYLLHSSVESDEMANVYSGNVTLDAGGAARVELPDWFEALNGDFRYQLTCIGGFAPVYVAEKISGNRFNIAGGDPGMEVSWQVTGIRHDPYSLEHRTATVQDKPAREVGKYRHPELYGMPETAGVSFREERAVAAQSGLTERRPLEPFDPTDGE